MRSLVRATVVFGLMLSMLASVGSAQEAKGKGKKKDAAAGGQQVFQLPKEITLTDEQKTKLEALKKEHSPKLAELAKKLDEGITDEQKKARREAMTKARADGKKGKDLQAEVDKALNLTDEQKKKRAETQPEMSKLQLSIKEQIHAMLTDDQKTHYKLPKAKKAK
ncbi:MAG: hypothetical protein AABP62_07700 [Planctomycetota bacterium]